MNFLRDSENIAHFTMRFFLAATASLLLAGGQLAASELGSLALDYDEIPWGEPGGGGGFPVGVQTHRVHTDPSTGGISYYALFPAGSHFDLHWHTHDEFVVVVKGRVTIQLGEEFSSVSAGGYIQIPGMLNHSWDVPADGEDVIIFVRRAGPPDFHFVE